MYARGTKPGGLVACREISRMRGDAVMTADHTAVQVCNSGSDRARIGRSSWKGLDMGHHEKAPVPCTVGCRLAALHGAPRTQLLHIAM